ncbi:GDSL-type esterase/lipase family protein [Clostridium gasigenes]|uniref:GDSL-like Lipase/Acylhydrolase n=1 Tax=Clostridium gasigenes TaxID=94869 RepID=A0A1H0NP51_9CLOT|nr:GDSL-type esterase/lipase family protein [Clostridium gasigenes]MBB6623628.1 hypothetical protein [Clostridium gasigenes]MBU3087571.1 hypothetical protein [Clostridium gasigenes]SDO94356.1 GDSL-like Lipase/Acylhydrolase [Clostridium gasigenes]
MKRTVLLVMSGILIFSIIKGAINGIDNKSFNENNFIGKEILVQLEQRNLSDVENEIDTYKNKYFQDKDAKEDRFNQTQGEENNSKYFQNTIFMGDSITEGLSELGVIEEYNVLVNKGDTVIKAINSIDTLTNLNPKNVVLLYGMNDVIEFDNSMKFKEKYIELVNEIKKVLPNTKIYLISPLSVMDKAVNINERLTNSNLDEFREKAQEVVRETGINYVDIETKINKKDYLHEKDGIHFKYEFYLIWLDYLREYI